MGGVKYVEFALEFANLLRGGDIKEAHDLTFGNMHRAVLGVKDLANLFSLVFGESLEFVVFLFGFGPLGIHFAENLLITVGNVFE